MRATIGALTIVASVGCAGDEGLIVRTVSEYGGTSIAGVEVQVGDQRWVTTGSSGEARFAATAAPYTVLIHQPMRFTDSHGVAHQNDKIWRLIGQTANPLVAEVDGSLAQIYKSSVSGTVTGRSGEPDTVVRIGGVLAAADGTFSDSQGIWWEGGPTYPFDLRALETDAASPPGRYLRFASRRVTATDTTGFLGSGGSLTGVTLQLAPVSEARVSGQVFAADAFAQAELHSSVALRFGRYDLYGVGAGTVSGRPAQFDYPVPRVDGSQPWITFSATAVAGGTRHPAFAGHARGVAAPASGLSFDLPGAPSLLEPLEGAAIGPSTVFRWTPVLPGGKYLLDMECDEWKDGAVTRGIHYRGVESAGTEASLPAIPGVSIPPGTACRWSTIWVAAGDPAVENRYSSSADRSAVIQ
ncbi:MAG TPA: hypothetical protein VFL36_20150 [Myxococcales bacterium]|nr:hypothetical protein [Myxococcales bacterium]